MRKTVGLGCIPCSRQISAAARRHCEYYVNNSGKCTAKPHREMAECQNFIAETFSDRMRMMSYKGHPRFEVMAYVGHGRTSVGQWLDSVWHRIPITSPDVDQAGYGKAGRCDTMDFGLSTGTQRAEEPGLSVRRPDRGAALVLGPRVARAARAAPGLAQRLPRHA